ncbi:hypothetical protein COO60DRAFT_159792 [Scenedesmus sp. NREL 46B-D3]|nr:hypothetical protein COO60DRAFT_159792 [Scenedesmus sp. NREL 46B-D3]
MQLKTGSLWSCGSSWPSLTAAVGGAAASSRPTELVKLWSNLRAATASPLERYCRLPEAFAVAAVAAGSSHLVLLSSAGEVIDTRAAAAAAAAALAHGEGQAAEAAIGLQQGVVLHAAAGVEGLQQQPGVVQLGNPWRLPGAAVASIAAGAGHVLAVTSCGRVWGWGSNTHGQLGLGTTQPGWQHQHPPRLRWRELGGLRVTSSVQLPVATCTARCWLPTVRCTLQAATGRASAGRILSCSYVGCSASLLSTAAARRPSGQRLLPAVQPTQPLPASKAACWCVVMPHAANAAHTT